MEDPKGKKKKTFSTFRKTPNDKSEKRHTLFQGVRWIQRLTSECLSGNVPKVVYFILKSENSNPRLIQHTLPIKG